MSKFAELAFKKFPSLGPQRNNLIILHGLMGNQANFKYFAKKPEFNTNTDVYTLDLRNHGASSHLPTMSVQELSADVINFMDTHDLQSSYILGNLSKKNTTKGHSLGGKVAMELALSNPARTSGAIICDIGPFNYPRTLAKSENYRQLTSLRSLNIENGKMSYETIKSKVKTPKKPKKKNLRFLS